MRGAEIDALFGPSRKHVHERNEWIAVAKVDDRLSGDDPVVDLPAGTVTLAQHRQPDAGEPSEQGA